MTAKESTRGREPIGLMRLIQELAPSVPDRRASLLVRQILQNNGTLAKGRRETFAELTDQEIAPIDEAVRIASPSETDARN